MPVRVTIKVKPGVRQAGIALVAGELVVAVRERAVDGAANAAVIAALATWLSVAPSRIAIEQGAGGRRKRIAIDGLDDSGYAAAIGRL